MTEVPLFTAAVAGFRAWDLRSDGSLWPHAQQAAGGWVPGENVATCIRSESHRAPVGGCTCGIHAFHTLQNRQLGEFHDLFGAVGAIAAWGEMEVYANGFRAERAAVMALIDNPRLPRPRRAMLRRAADRYGVPLLAREELMPYAWMATAPLPLFELHGIREDDRRGYVPEWHVWAEPADGLVTVGPTEGLRDYAGAGVEFVPLAAGAIVARGDAVARLGEADVRSPVAGIVRWAGEDGVGVAPSDWLADARELEWGRRGKMSELGLLLRDGAASFAEVCSDRPPSTEISSWWQLKAELRKPAPPRFAGEAALVDDLVIPLGVALQGDDGLRERLRALDLVVAFDLAEPAARLVLDLRTGTLSLGAERAELTLALAADDMHALVHGKLDVGRATRDGRIAVTGDRARALGCVSALRSLFVAAGFQAAPEARLAVR